MQQRARLSLRPLGPRRKGTGPEESEPAPPAGAAWWCGRGPRAPVRSSFADASAGRQVALCVPKASPSRPGGRPDPCPARHPAQPPALSEPQFLSVKEG